jgi:bleomycin hydrolase
MRKIHFFTGLLFSIFSINAQEAYQFTKVIDLETTPVISQGNTGTCWSFSTSSFLESEIIRLTGKAIDISEMYQVRNTYQVKAENYIMRQGKAQFSEGGLAHDVFNSIRDHGLVPNNIYSGLQNKSIRHDHAEMVAVLTSMLKTYVGNPGKTLSSNWRSAIDAMLDEYLGKKVSSFTFEGKEYTPQSFLEMTGIVPDDYVNITSFTHHPFYEPFILNIPDNFSNGSFHNIPIDELIETVDHALENGYTVELDCDVSEKTFSSKDGVAVIPSNSLNNLLALQGIYPEKKITQELRQQEFENYNTTDDHLMHITGTVTDQKGNKYYMVKNSWGTDPSITNFDGYVYFSEAYLRLKTISITLHRDGVPVDIIRKIL